MRELGGEDRFDARRRAWIARHQGWSTIQRRRAEQLDRRVRARQRERASAVPDPHDDTSMPPLWLRTTHSPAAQVEMVLLWAVLVIAPGGLLLGYLTKSTVVRLIPGTLRGYPVAALLWAAAGLGALTVLLDLTVDEVGFDSIVLAPWFCVQVVAAPATAGLLGIAEGWLAIPASRRWFPRTPPRPPVSSAEAIEILGGYDLTGPGPITAHRLNQAGERTR